MSFNIEGTVHEPFPKIRIIGIVARLHAVEPVLRLLNDADPDVRDSAMEALAG